MSRKSFVVLTLVLGAGAGAGEARPDVDGPTANVSSAGVSLEDAIQIALDEAAGTLDGGELETAEGVSAHSVDIDDVDDDDASRG